MIRGTTPIITLKVINGGELDLTTVDDLYVTLRQGQRIITLKEGVSVDAQSVSFYLTQREALSLKEGLADIQVNWIYKDADDGITHRSATRIQQIEITGQILDKVI